MLDLVISVDAHPRGAVLGDKLVGDRLAGIALLHADHQAGKIGNAVHVRMAAGVDDERLTGHRIGRAEIRDLLAFGRNGGARRNAVIGAGIETGENAVEVGALVADQLPRAAEFGGDALHQRNVEAGRTVFADELERRVG